MKETKTMLLGIVIMLISIYIVSYVAPIDGVSFDAANYYFVSLVLLVVGAIIAIGAYFKR